MKIKIERSGGLAGIMTCIEMDANRLPSELKDTARKFASDGSVSRIPLRSAPRGAADYYCYKITLTDGKNQQVLECNQYDIPDNLKSLISYVEEHSKKNGN